jgi:hypothetical protein
VLILLAAGDGDSFSDEALQAEAEARFRDGLAFGGDAEKARPNFLECARLYETLRQRGADNALLDRNLGNAYLLGGDLPRAILVYRRGLSRTPTDQRLQECLSYARSQVAYATSDAPGHPPREGRPPWLPRLATTWYVVLALTAYSLGWLAAARWWMLRQGRALSFALMSFATAAILIAGMTAEELRDQDLIERPVAVISEDGVLLRSGNGLRYPPRFETPLNHGVEARLLFTRGDWLQIELGGGEVGWVPREYALLDAPNSAPLGFTPSQSLQ